MLGDLCAPEGSPAWCVGMRNQIRNLLDQHQTDHEALQMCVASFVKEEGWKA